MAYLLSRSTASVWARPKRKEKRLDAEGGPRLSVSWQLPFGCMGATSHDTAARRRSLWL